MNCKIMSRDELYFEKFQQKETRACERLFSGIVQKEIKD